MARGVDSIGLTWGPGLGFIFKPFWEILVQSQASELMPQYITDPRKSVD